MHRYARFLCAATFLLLVAGGLVTSTGSGLAVPDWPTSYGYFMFSFPLRYMVGGIFYEHGHRLIASSVGLLTIGLVVWLAMRERRAWVRRLGYVALAAVITQGVLGGITVLWFLPAPVSIAHAGLAQIFFCLTIALAVVTSPGWRDGYGDERADDDRTLRRVALAATALVYLQILLGATMRHTGAGLAIPDFPLAFGRVVPPEWTPAIAIHFAHRVGALVVAAAALAAAGHVFAHHRRRPSLVRPAAALIALVAAQITLGAMTVLTKRAVDVNTAHVATGALVLATSLLLTLRAHRPLFAAPHSPARRAVNPAAPHAAGAEVRA
jgi:cytochrome c oxidase assembly protein subunit 15